MRSAWVYVNGEAIPKEEYVPPASGVMVMPDIQPYKSMITGEMIGSRSTHRQHLRRHGVIEVGNEKVKPKPIPDVPGLRDDIARAIYSR